MRKLLAAAAVTIFAVTGAAAVASAASAAPDTHQASYGTEYIQVMSTTTSGPASAIARGVFTAAGRADLGSSRTGTLVFPGGTITVSHQPGRGTSQIDPRTCLNVISRAGSYQITGGTGQYAGIRGHGTYLLSLEFISARSHGQCTSSKPPLVQQELLQLSGPVRL
jgi:hypothetical protein